MKLFVIGALVCALALGATIPAEEAEFKLPEFAKTCTEDDPNLNECLRSAVQDMMPRLNNGLDSLHIPPLDPFTIESNHFEYGNGIIQGDIKMKNLKVYGMSQANFTDIRMNIKGERVETEVDIYFPKIFMEAVYKADVKFNDLKLHPKGHFNVTMTDINVTHMWAGTLIPKKGRKYLHIDEFDMIPEVGDMKIYVGGIFPDPTLNTIAINFLNQYWPVIYKTMLPETRIYWQPIMINSINKFLHNVPFDLLVTSKKE